MTKLHILEDYCNLFPIQRFTINNDRLQRGKKFVTSWWVKPLRSDEEQDWFDVMQFATIGSRLGSVFTSNEYIYISLASIGIPDRVPYSQQVAKDMQGFYCIEDVTTSIEESVIQCRRVQQSQVLFMLNNIYCQQVGVPVYDR